MPGTGNGRRSENSLAPDKALVTGAAGFIGSHLTDRLLQQGLSVIGVDNLSRGVKRNLEPAFENPRFRFFEIDLSNVADLRRMFSDFPLGTVWHMVANSDIPAGSADPNIDLRDTFLTTFNLLLAMREAKVKRIAFASTSAVYGVHPGALKETTGPLFPISNYGAMKLGCEGMISAAVESFLERAWIFRFPNVVGPRATHGILFDLLNNLKNNRKYLPVLGDGHQQKPYLHVSELIDAMLFIEQHACEPVNCFNIGPADEGVTVRRIAEMVINAAAPSTPIRFTGGDKGWVGDVPKFHYSIDKIKTLGWQPRFSSAKALEQAVTELRSEILNGSISEQCR